MSDNIELIGKSHRECEVCKKYKNQNFYRRFPHGAVIKLLPEKYQEPKTICTDCANRYAGKQVIRGGMKKKTTTKRFK